MRKKKIIIIISIVTGILLCIGAFFLVATVGPWVPDCRSLERHAQVAQRYAVKHGLNHNYCLLLNYGIPSGTPRLFVWSFEDNKVVYQACVMHGSGKGSTAEKPSFRNIRETNCSSLGKFEVTRRSGETVERSFRLDGLSLSNYRSLSRGIMIHPSQWVDTHLGFKYIPLDEDSCKGCVTVSTKDMDYLYNLITTQDSDLLLWTYYNRRK